MPSTIRKKTTAAAAAMPTRLPETGQVDETHQAVSVEPDGLLGQQPTWVNSLKARMVVVITTRMWVFSSPGKVMCQNSLKRFAPSSRAAS